MPREIEVKFKLTPEQKILLEEWLDKNAYQEGTTHQVENYLDNPEHPFIFQNKNGFKDSEHYLRVRQDEQKGDSVCLKIFRIDQEKQTSENLDEIEYTVSDGNEALKLFEKIGFIEKYVVDKTRVKYESNNKKFEICLDEVKGLGFFAEVELKEQITGDIKVGWHMIYDFLISIGISEIDEQHRGYVSMIWNPEINFGKQKNLL